MRNDKWVGHADMVRNLFRSIAFLTPSVMGVTYKKCLLFKDIFWKKIDLSVRPLRQGSSRTSQHDRHFYLRRRLAFVERTFPATTDRSARGPVGS